MEALRSQIADLGLKQNWIAQKLSVSPVMLNYWLTGTRPMPQHKEEELKRLLIKLKEVA